MHGRPLLCPGCADGTELGIWPQRTESPYRSHDAEPSVQVQACGICAGVWVDRATLHALLEDAARTAAHDPQQQVRRRTLAPGAATRKVVYRSCPECKGSMVRKNFGSVSGVVVDVCGHHGTFFEYGELPAVIDFVRSGGLRLTEQAAAAEEEREARHRASQAMVQSPGMGPAWLEGDLSRQRSDEFTRSVGVFLRNMFR